MPRYQIRIPEGMEIEDLIDELAAKSWQMLALVPEEIALPPKKEGVFKEFRTKILETLKPVIKTFRLCGLSNICSEKLESTELSLESHTLDASPTDKIFQFMIKEDLHEFTRHLSNETLDSIQPLFKVEERSKLSTLVNVAFREVIGEYLYNCPTCGKTELCVCSQAAPEPVWKPK